MYSRPSSMLYFVGEVANDDVLEIESQILAKPVAQGPFAVRFVAEREVHGNSLARDPVHRRQCKTPKEPAMVATRLRRTVFLGSSVTGSSDW